ncbi:MAG: GNAT family N-acetyltransferase, partial [Candidatus Hydrogenedentes bacterium]|nr:GNAT family N-acetyltransferase [Candidatus Hydrogenedentota bacterium]
MNIDTNELGQPIGRPVTGWRAPARPERAIMAGQYCRLEPLAPERHATELFDAVALDRENRMWTYLPYGPFETADEYGTWMVERCTGADPMFFAIVDLTSGRATGVAAYLRIEPTAGSIEVGHLAYSPLLQRTR